MRGLLEPELLRLLSSLINLRSWSPLPLPMKKPFLLFIQTGKRVDGNDI
jgi:hypothetical protein